MRSMILAMAGFATAASAQAPIGGDLEQAVRTSVDRGALLYSYDEAAWHGTDDFLEHFSQLKAGAGGYVVSGTRADVELVFYSQDKKTAVYRAKFANEKLVSSGPPAEDRTPLTPVELKLIAAREQALDAFFAAKVAMCAEAKPNIALLPPATSDQPVLAYLMTPRTKMTVLPLGGHYSLEVSANGQVGTIRAFTKSCINMPIGDEGGRQQVAGVVTDLTDATPNEIHVFSSLSAKLPIYVSTIVNSKVWLVDGAGIQLVDPKSAPK